jgi:RNA polymerase sigma-70 factor (family 1)
MVSPKKCNDEELTALLRGGDQPAFTEIYNRYWSLLYAHVYKMLRDKGDTEDVVQEIFSTLWLKKEGLSEATNLRGFLYVSARNRVFNLIGQQRVRQDYLGVIAAFIGEADLGTLQQLDENELAGLLDSEIRLLPAKMREVFELSRKENLSHKEIAARLQLSEQTVKKQVQNALKILKPRLKDAGLGAALLFLFR